MTRDGSDVDNLLLDAGWYGAGNYGAGNYQDTVKILRDEDPVHWIEDSSSGKDYLVGTIGGGLETTRNAGCVGLWLFLCLGRYLARLEQTTFLTKVLAAFPDLEVVDPAHPAWLHDRSNTKFREMKARFSLDRARVLRRV